MGQAGTAHIDQVRDANSMGVWSVTAGTAVSGEHDEASGDAGDESVTAFSGKSGLRIRSVSPDYIAGLL